MAQAALRCAIKQLQQVRDALKGANGPSMCTVGSCHGLDTQLLCDSSACTAAGPSVSCGTWICFPTAQEVVVAGCEEVLGARQLVHCSCRRKAAPATIQPMSKSVSRVFKKASWQMPPGNAAGGDLCSSVGQFPGVSSNQQNARLFATGLVLSTRQTSHTEQVEQPIHTQPINKPANNLLHHPTTATVACSPYCTVCMRPAVTHNKPHGNDDYIPHVSWLAPTNMLLLPPPP